MRAPLYREISVHTQPPGPVDLIVRDATARAAPVTYRLQSLTVFDLLTETVGLAKLLATEERDLLAIRTEYELRTASIANLHAVNMNLIDREYEERKINSESFFRSANFLMEKGQYEIAQQLMNRLADILASSPLDKVLSKR